MNNYEKLLDRAEKENIRVIEQYDFSEGRIKALYCDGTVALNRNIATQSEKACILAEELGHYYTSSGNILDQSKVQNRKQELHARLWAYNQKIGLSGLVNAYRHGCQNSFEIAEYLEVTEQFLSDAVSAYRSKYGRCHQVDNYIIFFEPYLAVLEKSEGESYE